MKIFSFLTTKRAILIITALGFIVFGNALFNNFVWDDGIFLNNPEKFNTSIPHFFTENLAMAVGYYRPIYLLYFALLYKVFGSQAFFYHFFQVSLHILNTIILYVVLRKILNSFDTDKQDKEGISRLEENDWKNLSNRQKKKYRKMYQKLQMQTFKAMIIPNLKTNLLALFLSLVFLVHPINVESVAYFAATNNELFFLFGILALWISMKENINMKDLFFVSGLTLLSLLSKETGFVFPLIIVCFQYLYQRRRFVKFFVFELVTLGTYFYIRFAIGGVFFSKFIIRRPIPIEQLPFLGRLTNIPAIVFYYLTTTFLPLRLAIDQKWIVTKLTAQGFYLPLLMDSIFLIALIVSGIYIYNHQRKYFTVFLFFFVWFISGLLFLVQIFPLDMTVADRFFYFPLIGLLGMLVIGLQIFLFSPEKEDTSLINYEKEKLAVVFGTVLILLLSVRTIVRNANFKDEITLFTHDSHIEDNADLEDFLGVEYAATGNLQASLTHLEKSVNLSPFGDNLFHLGNWYESQGNLRKAQEYYYKALSAADLYYSMNNTRNRGESDLEIYTRLTKLLLLSNEFDAAAKICKNGVAYYSRSSILWAELAISEYELHNQNEAVIAAEKAKTFSPNDVTNLLYSLIINKQGIPSIVTQMLFKQEVAKTDAWMKR